MGYEPNGRIVYMHNQPRAGGSNEIPADIAINGDDVEVQQAWEDYGRGLASYGITLISFGTIFALVLAIASCVACAQACCFKGETCRKPSVFPRLAAIWSFAAFIGTAAIIAVVSPTAVRNLGNAFVDGLDTGIDFLEISVRLGSEVQSIGDGIDNMTVAANSINARLQAYPQSAPLRASIDDFILAVQDSSSDVRSSGGDISESTGDARAELLKIRDDQVRGQISRGTNSNGILNFLFFLTFAVVGVLPMLESILPIGHKFLTGITCCCCIWPTFLVAGVLGVVGMAGSDVCFDIEDTLVALISLGDEDDIPARRALLEVAEEGGSMDFAASGYTGNIEGALQGAWTVASKSGVLQSVAPWVLDEDSTDASSSRLLQLNDDTDDGGSREQDQNLLAYYLKCHESPAPPLPGVLSSAQEGAVSFYQTSNQLNEITRELKQYYTQNPQLKPDVTRMVAGFRTINGSVANTLDLFLCDGVNEPIYRFISIVCNDAVGNGIVLAFQLSIGTAFLALLGLIPNLLILSRHPAEEYKEPQAVTVTNISMVPGGEQPNPTNQFSGAVVSSAGGGYPGVPEGTGGINADPPVFAEPFKAPQAPPIPVGTMPPPVAPAGPVVHGGSTPFIAQPSGAPTAPPPPAGFEKVEH